MLSLQGKRALVTGSSRGIGRGIALALAAAGCHVAIHCLRKRSAGQETAAAVMALGVQAPVLQANLNEDGAARELVERASAALGGLDILVCNAASGVLKPAVALETHDWEWTFNVNVRSVLACAQAAVPFMQRQGWGRIVTISSPGSRRVVADYAAVGASKSALESLTRYLAVELAPHGIIVNCVSPGLVVTGALDHFPNRAGMIDHAARATPAGRLVTPEDVGRAVAWLCSDDAAMVVGQIITVDGGYELALLPSL